LEMSLAWYLGSEADPKHVWLRRLVHDAARAVGLSARARNATTTVSRRFEV
jgi:hypothetical protein